MMINLLHPKYILPVQGEYRHQYACIQIANCVGFDTVNNLIIPDNGDLYNFTDGVLTGVKGSVPVGEIMNDGDVAGDVGQVVMRDRELLGESGVILLYSNINPRTKKVITPLQIVCKGFAYITEHPEFNEKITKAFENVCEKYLQQARIDWSEFKSDIRNAVSRMVYKEANASPIIIPVLISTDPSHLLKTVINMDQTKKAASKKVAPKSEKKVVKKDSKKESKESTTPKTKEVKKTVKKVVKKEEKTSEKPKTVKKTVRKVVKKDSPKTTSK
jgi:ribonuclease J